MSDQPIRAIQVGAGGFGHAWRRPIEENGCQVVALVDPKQEALTEAAEHFGLDEKACFAPDAAWDQVEADLIIDATPHAHHRRNAERALANGKDVLVVKPMALDEADCHAMVRIAEDQGRKLAVAQQLRFHPVIMKVRELVQNGSASYTWTGSARFRRLTTRRCFAPGAGRSHTRCWSRAPSTCSITCAGSPAVIR
jgi:predicted dehydrogenase